MIELKNLTKKFGTHEVLHDLNIHFKKGHVYGIVGENGAGKTTLFRCIAGLEQYEGEIKSEITPLKNHLGLLQTEPFFFDKMTGREYIQFLCNARNVVLENLAEKNIFDLPLDQYASTYSTGMKKKLALTAILMQKNNVFILDEPYNGVDIQSNLIITEIIHQLKQLGKTILISSHIFSTLSATCDEINVMENGRFTRNVKPDEFDALESDMKEMTIGDKIEKLELE